jgi:cytidyltransferase-like protein
MISLLNYRLSSASCPPVTSRAIFSNQSTIKSMRIHYPTDPKAVTFSQAQELIKRARKKGLVTVLAHGVFDVIHIGHTTFLKDAKQRGDLLFVCLERDEGVSMNKGSSRPLNPLEERLQLMADLQCADCVFAFE